MTILNLRWLAGFTAVYLFLLPTNHGTYLRSIAFGGSILFAVFALGWSLRERQRAAGGANTRCHPWSITLTVAAWFAWSAAVVFLVGQAALHVRAAGPGGRARTLLLIVLFYIACCDVVAFRRYAAIVLAVFVIMAALAIGYRCRRPAGIRRSSTTASAPIRPTSC